MQSVLLSIFLVSSNSKNYFGNYTVHCNLYCWNLYCCIIIAMLIHVVNNVRGDYADVSTAIKQTPSVCFVKRNLLQLQLCCRLQESLKRAREKESSESNVPDQPPTDDPSLPGPPPKAQQHTESPPNLDPSDSEAARPAKLARTGDEAVDGDTAAQASVSTELPTDSHDATTAEAAACQPSAEPTVSAAAVDSLEVVWGDASCEVYVVRFSRLMHYA